MHLSGPLWRKNLLLSIRNASGCWPLWVCFSFGSQASSSLVLQSWAFPLMLTLPWALFAQSFSLGWQRLCEFGIIVWQLPWSILLSLLFFHKYYSPACVCAQSLQLCPTLCDPIDCSPPGSSVHGILQVRILERVPPGDLPNSGLEPGVSTLQADSLLLSLWQSPLPSTVSLLHF